MSAFQVIIVLLVFLIVVVSIQQMFFKEPFINGTGLGYIGQEIKEQPVRINSHNGALGYPGLGYNGVANPPPHYVIHSDDQPLSYGFPPSQTKSI